MFLQYKVWVEFYEEERKEMKGAECEGRDGRQRGLQPKRQGKQGHSQSTHTATTHTAHGHTTHSTVHTTHAAHTQCNTYYTHHTHWKCNSGRERNESVEKGRQGVAEKDRQTWHQGPDTAVQANVHSHIHVGPWQDWGQGKSSI